MASYYSELGIKEKEDRAGGGTPGAGGRGNRWVSQAVDDFMNIGSNRPTPVAAMASPERFLNVARLYSDFMDNNEGSSGGGADMSNHQQFLESLIMQLYEEANATSAGPPPASREFIRTLPVVTKDQFKDSDVISCTICNEDVFSEETAIAAHDSVTKLPSIIRQVNCFIV
ncbi:hypothetical protein BX070DRAFT_221806 [Coemansia spiralis]|nr:hypothetical protein BX070DRAFT_221806 [Coemansia spiralis]